MNLADLTAAPRTATIGGKTFPIKPLRPRDLGIVEAWIRDHVPGPLAAIRPALDLYAGDPEAKRVLLERAYADQLTWPPAITSPEGWALAIGQARAAFLAAILRRGGAEVGTAEAEAQADEMDFATWERVLLLAMGKDPDDPKSLPGTTPAATTTTPAPAPSPPTGA